MLLGLVKLLSGLLYSKYCKNKEEKELKLLIEDDWNKHPHSLVTGDALENRMGKSSQEIDVIARRLDKEGDIIRVIDKGYRPKKKRN